MTEYNDMLIEADENNLIVKDKPLRANTGRIKGNRIAIKRDLLEREKKCVLAEELGHYHTTIGDIVSQSTISDHKQELRARAWAYNKLIGLNEIINSYKYGCSSLNDMAEYLDVTEEFLLEALQYYKSKYGICVTLDSYTIYFEPSLGVFGLV